MNPSSPRSPSSPLIRANAAIAACLPALSFAAEPTAVSAGISFSSMLQTFLGLALVLGVFVGAAWLMRRINGGGLLGQNGPLRVLGGLAIGTRERIVLVEIEDTWLVIGIAPGQIRTLHTLPKGTASPLPAEAANQFGAWLKQFKERRNDTAS